MNSKYFIQPTVFFVSCIIAFVGISISSLILINSNGMDQRLQGWVNLLWLPAIILVLIIDRLLVKKFDVKKVNEVQLYVLGTAIVLFLINWLRLELQ